MFVDDVKQKIKRTGDFDANIQNIQPEYSNGLCHGKIAMHIKKILKRQTLKCMNCKTRKKLKQLVRRKRGHHQTS